MNIEEFLKTGVWTIIGGVLGFILKSFWDRFWKRRDEIRAKKIETLERQLFEFYMPIYLRLQKDNVIWQRILDRASEDEIRQKVGAEIDKSVILPNHREIVKIIETKSHLSKADKELSSEILQYLKHVTIYEALRTSGITAVDPIHLGEPWSNRFFELIEAKVSSLQSEYDSLLNLQLGKDLTKIKPKTDN